jgi:hypothetical protein
MHIDKPPFLLQTLLYSRKPELFVEFVGDPDLFELFRQLSSVVLALGGTLSCLRPSSTTATTTAAPRATATISTK